MKDALGHGSAPRGDGTYDKRTGKSPTHGIMVGNGTGRGRYTGVWTDKATGKVYTETANRFSSMALAKSVARQRDQIAAWDLDHNTEIHIGGSGNIPIHAQAIENATRGRKLAGLNA